MAWYGKVGYGIIRYGIAYGVVRNGRVWYDMVWYGMMLLTNSMVRYGTAIWSCDIQGVTRHCISWGWYGRGMVRVWHSSNVRYGTIRHQDYTLWHSITIYVFGTAQHQAVCTDHWTILHYVLCACLTFNIFVLADFTIFRSFCSLWADCGTLLLVCYLCFLFGFCFLFPFRVCIRQVRVVMDQLYHLQDYGGLKLLYITPEKFCRRYYWYWCWTINSAGTDTICSVCLVRCWSPCSGILFWCCGTMAVSYTHLTLPTKA